ADPAGACSETTVSSCWLITNDISGRLGSSHSSRLVRLPCAGASARGGELLESFRLLRLSRHARRSVLLQAQSASQCHRWLRLRGKLHAPARVACLGVFW